MNDYPKTTGNPPLPLTRRYPTPIWPSQENTIREEKLRLESRGSSPYHTPCTRHQRGPPVADRHDSACAASTYGGRCHAAQRVHDRVTVRSFDLPTNSPGWARDAVWNCLYRCTIARESDHRLAAAARRTEVEKTTPPNTAHSGRTAGRGPADPLLITGTSGGCGGGSDNLRIRRACTPVGSGHRKRGTWHPLHGGGQRIGQ